jgi:hypothetical protein
MGPAGSPAAATALLNSRVAASTASSRLPAVTTSRAPYRSEPMPEATPSIGDGAAR